MAGMLARRARGPARAVRYFVIDPLDPPDCVLTCMYSIRPSSCDSLRAVTLEAGNPFGAMLNKTFRREFVMTREPIETKQY